ncbi:hypothetical protein N7523_009565 [Penicillium sp. IBT 18751x]|nr:hypothetical protein N7523_009565 [Penicillium sp. IBT 18751x]
MLDQNPGYFTSEVLPLIHGPAVKIRIEPPGRVFVVAKDLLCKQSSYFAKMFNGKFSEGKTNEATLKVIEGVLSLQSFEMLLQWLYIGNITYYSGDVGAQISALIELARLADMCAVHALEAATAKFIKMLIVDTSDLARVGYKMNPNANTYALSSHNIHSATELPQGHKVRAVLAGASVEGYLRSENHKFRAILVENTSFKEDLICELKKGYKKISSNTAYVVDPISEKNFSVDPSEGSELSQLIKSNTTDAA